MVAVMTRRKLCTILYSCVHNDQGTLEPIAQPKKLTVLLSTSFLGGVAIRSCSQERGVYTLTVYEGTADGAWALERD